MPKPLLLSLRIDTWGAVWAERILKSQVQRPMVILTRIGLGQVISPLWVSVSGSGSQSAIKLNIPCDSRQLCNRLVGPTRHCFYFHFCCFVWSAGFDNSFFFLMLCHWIGDMHISRFLSCICLFIPKHQKLKYWNYFDFKELFDFKQYFLLLLR